MHFLLLNQTFYPDVASTAQHLSDLAVALVERGHRVTVIAGRHAYDDPATRFPARETWRGIRIVRIGGTGFGKASKWRRALDFASFFFLCAIRLVRVPRPDVVVALTSPPLISFLGAWLARVRRARFCYWVMDFNPDEATAAGWLARGSLVARVLDWMSRFSLKRADKIIALDRFMRDRIVAKGISTDKIAVLPPWSHDSEVKFDSAGRERFRKAHGLEGKFVVMYSGNHSPCHPLNTLLEAARRLANEPEIAFCFVGGGSEWRRIRDAFSFRTQVAPESAVRTSLSNLFCLPYQPLAGLSASLSAGDLQVVVMGNPFVGLVHPCKIYNVLNVGAPVLYIGPRVSHIADIAAGANGQFSCADHGDVDSVVEAIRRVRKHTVAARYQISPAVRSSFAREKTLPRLMDELTKLSSGP